MRKLTAAQADAEHVAVNVGHLVTYAETRKHGPDWDAAVAALRLAMHCLGPVTAPDMFAPVLKQKAA